MSDPVQNPGPGTTGGPTKCRPDRAARAPAREQRLAAASYPDREAEHTGRPRPAGGALEPGKGRRKKLARVRRRMKSMEEAETGEDGGRSGEAPGGGGTPGENVKYSVLSEVGNSLTGAEA